MDLEALVVAGDGSIDLAEHGKGVAKLHVAREGSEGVIGIAFDVEDFNSAFEDGDDYFKASEAAVDGGEDVEAHGEVEAGLSLADATLEGLGGPDGEVEGLGGPIARGNGVASQFKEEWAEIRVVERGIKEKRRGFWSFLFRGARRRWGGWFFGIGWVCPGRRFGGVGSSIRDLAMEGVGLEIRVEGSYRQWGG